MHRREELTVTRNDVLARLHVGEDWTTAAEHLGIAPGLAFMIATGIPADGSGVPEIPKVASSAPTLTSPQSLVNDRGHNPLTKSPVNAWVQQRARRELDQ